MAFANPDIMDAALTEMSDNADTYIVSNGEPTDYDDATTDVDDGGSRMGDVAVDSDDFTLQDGDPDGREVEVAAQSVSIDGTSTETNADYIAIVDDTNERLLIATPLEEERGYVDGDTAEVDAFTQRIADPTAE